MRVIASLLGPADPLVLDLVGRVRLPGLLLFAVVAEVDGVVATRVKGHGFIFRKRNVFLVVN